MSDLENHWYRHGVASKPSCVYPSREAYERMKYGDPKPVPRIKDPGLMRLLHTDPHKQCAVTGSTDRVELHHILPRSSGRGDDVRENLVLLDADFHAAVTRNDALAITRLGQHIQSERPDTIAYLRRKLGPQAEDWMRRRLHIEVNP